jgi:putative aldouronate transport system substrate-binding protein
MTSTETSRRRFLQGVGGAAIAGLSAPLLDGCGKGATTSAANNDAVKLPAYEPRYALNPDLPVLADGTPGALFKYPAQPKKLYHSPPGKGSTINVLKMIDNGPPVPMGQNHYWQQLNKRLGAKLQLTNVSTPDYSAKLATTIASGDIPDIVQLPTSVPHLPDVLAKEFQELTPWLSGDAIKDYVGLPAMSTTSWKNVVFNGGIWGIPWQLGLPASILEIRQDLVEEKGLSTHLSSGQDFLDLCAALTNPRKSTWAVGTTDTAMNIVREMVGVPNTWQENDGKFTSMYETDEFRRALSIVSSIWKKGYIYPDSLTSAAGISQWFGSGKVAMSAGGYTNWSLYITANTPLNPKFKIGGLIPAKWDGGGQAAHWSGNGMYTFTAIRKSSKARTEELLRVLDWFAAPFGSEEYTFRRYGVPGRDYALKNGQPSVSNQGTNEVQNMNIGYICTCPLLLYVPGQTESTRAEYDFLKQLMSMTVSNPTVGLYSETELTKGASISKNITDLQNSIIVGHEKLSAWDDGVKAWRAGGGDDIRHDYETAYRKVHK